jgi:hypothetical protein
MSDKVSSAGLPAAAISSHLGDSSSSAVSSSPIEFSIARSGCGLTNGAVSGSFSFKNHTRVVELRKLFLVVELVSVAVTIYQVSARAASSSSPYKPYLIRHGVGPRGLVGHDGTVNLVSDWPHMSNFTTTVDNASSQTIVHGRGGIPFPSGVLFDLNVVETRSPVAEYLVGIANPVSQGSDDLVLCQFDFIVACSGQNFGAP